MAGPARPAGPLNGLGSALLAGGMPFCDSAPNTRKMAWKRFSQESKIMAPSWFQILIVIVLLVLLFGRGKISDLMGDVAKGIKSFKKGITEDEETASESETVKTIDHSEAETANTGKAASQKKAKAS
jgi:sec-independent protein translocase protein TatA